jgi:uncharacterized tellurite resistance protein B-like protein
MINRLFDFLEELVSEDEPQGTHDEQAIHLAAAALMLEVARSDTIKQEVELAAIEEILKSQFQLPQDQIHELIAAASDRVEAAHDLFQFTQLINAHFNYDEKRQLLLAMWLVAFADGHVEAIEGHIIRRVSDLLNLQHKDFIQLKVQARDNMPAGGT